MTLYHFTDPKNLPSIRKRGLVPRPLRHCPHMKGCVAYAEAGTGSPGGCESGAVMLTVHIDTSDVHLG